MGDRDDFFAFFFWIKLRRIFGGKKYLKKNPKGERSCPLKKKRDTFLTTTPTATLRERERGRMTPMMRCGGAPRTTTTSSSSRRRTREEEEKNFSLLTTTEKGRRRRQRREDCDEEVAKRAAMIGGIIAASASVVALASPVVTARAETKFLPIPQTSVPETTSCGNFSPERLQIAREILICNQESGAKNWKQACLSHYAPNVEYTDGPGLTRVFGRENMRQYLKNQFDFSRQWLSVTDEACDKDKYVAEWNLSMDLGIGSFRDLPGVTVLKFMEDGSDLVKYHRDYLPDGNIVERQPVVGNLVKFQRETYSRCMASKEGCVKLLGGPVDR